MEKKNYEAIFWRAFLANAGPSLGFSAEGIEDLSDEDVVDAGHEVIEGFKPLFESVGRLVAAGVDAYRSEVR